MVFGYYAARIGRVFFPSGSAFASLMLSLMTFGAGFVDAAGRRDRPRRVHGSPRASGGAAPHADADGPRHAEPRGHAGLRRGRRDRADCHRARAAPSGVLGGRRARRRLGVPVGDRDPGEEGLLRQLAVGQPAGGGGLRRAPRRLPRPPAGRGAHGCVGMARPVPRRLRDPSLAPLSPAVPAETTEPFAARATRPSVAAILRSMFAERPGSS